MTSQSSTTTATYGYGVLAHQFTGKERDAETGLDFFGARYYSGAQGRFSSPDVPLLDRDALTEDPTRGWRDSCKVVQPAFLSASPTLGGQGIY